MNLCPQICKEVNCLFHRTVTEKKSMLLNPAFVLSETTVKLLRRGKGSQSKAWFLSRCQWVCACHHHWNPLHFAGVFHQEINQMPVPLPFWCGGVIGRMVASFGCRYLRFLSQNTHTFAGQANLKPSLSLPRRRFKVPHCHSCFESWASGVGHFSPGFRVDITSELLGQTNRAAFSLHKSKSLGQMGRVLGSTEQRLLSRITTFVDNVQRWKLDRQ